MLRDYDMLHKGFWYLAGPYTGNENLNYQYLSQVASALILEGVSVFSPITQSHILQTYYGCTLNGEQWLDIDHQFVVACAGILLCKLPGWQESKGVQRELEWAHKYKKPVVAINTWIEHADVNCKWAVPQSIVHFNLGKFHAVY